MFFEKLKSYIFYCISLQNNIEAELEFFSSFEAFFSKYKKNKKARFSCLAVMIHCIKL